MEASKESAEQNSMSPTQPPVVSSSTSRNIFSSHFQNSKGHISQFIEQRRFMHIPPPAGFDFPTRPSTLLAALVRGPVSLDEASLSPATQRRLAYIHRHSQSSHQIRTHHKGAENESEEKYLERNEQTSTKLPTSPLSPPSPFQHPFFRRQLGLLPADPWARFSGFSKPIFNSFIEDSLVQDSKQAIDDAKIDDDASSTQIRIFQKNKYTLLDSKGCQDSNFYRESRISQAYSDGVSETESEDDDDEPFTTPINSKNFLFNFDNNNTRGSSSSGEDVLPCSSASTASSSNNNSSKVSEISGPISTNLLTNIKTSTLNKEEEFNRNSQVLTYEGENIDDNRSLVSEPESFHDALSPCSSFTNRDYCEERTTISELCPVDQNDSNESAHLPSVGNENQDACSKKEKLNKIALELLYTERSYVNVLHLIDQEFQFRVDQLNRVHHLFPPEQMPLMFSNIKSIYKLHHDFLLPQLEERISKWESCSRIGDIMKSFAPFLKMYTEYVKNFDNAMNIISSWQAKSQRFSAIMEEIHQMECCGNLTLQHHMLSPVQRIPRYEMLLKDYLRKLPETNPDKEDTEEALRLVSTAANHANDAMKKIDKFQKLLEVQESLGGSIELVSPTRELIKEGRIIKISARSGDHQERYLFLFSDLLLLCTPRLMGGRVISGPQYRLRAKYKVENLRVLEGDNLETAHTFYIKDSNKTVELYTNTKEEKESWLESLFNAITETCRRKSSLRLSGHSEHKINPDPDLGQKQPTLIRTDSVTKCMHCGLQFSVVRRKHHCRACGSVVCYKCSNLKASLPCEGGKNVRVCRTCYKALNEMESGTNTSTVEVEDKKFNECQIIKLDSKNKFESLDFESRGILEISANDSGSIIQGYLQLKTHRKIWLKRWFSLHSDFVLYSFRTDDDLQALTATPIPGFTVSRIHNSRNETGLYEKDKDKCFKVYHAKKQYVFLSSSKEDAAKWVYSLQKASRAELPSPEK